MILVKLLEKCDISIRFNDDVFAGLSNEYLFLQTDSRLVKKRDLFVAIKGEKVDAFIFAQDILRYCNVFVYEVSPEKNNQAKSLAERFPSVALLGVSSVVTFLQELTAIQITYWYEQKPSAKLIAISGCNGKTTTKEMLSHILSKQFQNKYIFTEKNNNNHLGVPLTLLKIHPPSTEVAVVEFGSNHPGEMKVLCDVSYPNVGITTNIGYAHMEFFKDLNEVFKEEALIYYTVMQRTNNKGFFLINEDDEYLRTLPRFVNVKGFSFKDKGADFYYELTGYQEIQISYLREKKCVKIKNNHIMGEHNFCNLANSFILADTLFPGNPAHFLEMCSSFIPSQNRSQWLKYRDLKTVGVETLKEKIFLDAYNANPSSMEVALKSFKSHLEGINVPIDEVLLCLGDMKELGTNEGQFHTQLGFVVKNLGFKNIVYTGAMGEFFRDGLGFSPIKIFKNLEEAKVNSEFLKKAFYENQIIFIKASRSLQLERLIDITKG